MGSSHSSSRAKHGNGSIKLKYKKIRQQLLVESGYDLETTNSQFCIPRNNQDIDRMQLQHCLFIQDRSMDWRHKGINKVNIINRIFLLLTYNLRNFFYTEY